MAADLRTSSSRGPFEDLYEANHRHSHRSVSAALQHDGLCAAVTAYVGL